MNRVFSYSDIEHLVRQAGAKLFGNADAIRIAKASTPGAADPLSVVWIGEKFKEAAASLQSCKASLIVAHYGVESLLDKVDLDGRCVITSTSPRLLFAAIANTLFNPAPSPGIDPTAVIHPDASIAGSVYVGPYAYVGKATLEEGVVIHGHCYIYEQTFIGRRCIVHAHCVIGAPGSGYVKNEQGRWEGFPQIGTTILEEDVEVGTNTYIARGALGETRIGRGVKIGLAACIGHNVVIGENSMMLANAVVGGSTVIGKNAWVSMGALIRDGLVLGDNARIGMGAVVYKDVPDGANIVGNPGREMGRA
jgi:UDP-3-O-[3-hydroxymyristoyl] glucosamine N-acyltransferase